VFKNLALLIVLVAVGCADSQKVVIPENPTALPPEDMLQIGGGEGTTTTDSSSPPPLPAPGQ